MPDISQPKWKPILADIIRRDFPVGTTIKLDELYAYKSQLQLIFPKNKHIEEKLRQVCQDLCKLGLLQRQKDGEYLYSGGFEHDFKLLGSLNGSVIDEYNQSASLAILNVSADNILVASLTSDETKPETEIKIRVSRLKRAWEKLQSVGNLTQKELEQEEGAKEITALLATLPNISYSNNGDLAQNFPTNRPPGTIQKEGTGEIIGPGVVSKTSRSESELLVQIKELSQRNLRVGEKSRISRARILVRDRAIADALKGLYAGECQICRFTIDLPGNKRYSEHHHMRAKSVGGADIASNLLVVCPNHHKILDYNVGVVQPDKEGWTFSYQNQSQLLLLNKHLGLI